MKHVLMIKKVLGHELMYLCKSSSQRIELDDEYVYKYRGSGKRWLNHLKAHPGIVVTCVIGTYNTTDELKSAGEFYSSLFDVVNSNSWANLTEEKGSGGLIGTGQLGKRWKMSALARENVKRSRETSPMTDEQKQQVAERFKGKNNYQCRGIIRTPWGDFYSIKDACAAAKIARKSGRCDVITDEQCLRMRVESLDSPFTTSRIAFEGWRGKTPREVGFDIIPKELRHEN